MKINRPILEDKLIKNSKILDQMAFLGLFSCIIIGAKKVIRNIRSNKIIRLTIIANINEYN